METWEVILILGLVTISLMVLLNHNIAQSLISLLDNPMFQLTIVGLTLTIAGLSPPVAIVGIATIVIVYYVRNLNKVEIINLKAENQIEKTNETNPEPRLLIEQVNTQYVKIKEYNVPQNTVAQNTVPQNTVAQNTVSQNNSAQNTVPQNNLVQNPTIHTRPEDKDVLESALKEHNEVNSQNRPINYKIPCGEPVKSLTQDNYSTQGPEGFHVESADPKIEVYGSAPKPGVSNFISEDKKLFTVDSNVYTKGESVPIEYNEFTAQPTNRPYDKSEGQYIINENRPYQSAQKYEVADFTPGTDMGENKFTVVGNSIDDKITNLKKGIQISRTPPPNFDVVEPSMPKSM